MDFFFLVAYLGLSNAKAIVHQMEGPTAHHMVRLLHMKWRGYCTGSGEASANEVERTLHRG
jgi:hypothetical protein